VKGKLFSSGWGAALGFPGLILNPRGPSVDVDPFESTDIPEHWARLYEFEGSGYPACGYNGEHKRGRTKRLDLRPC
jgi:hypothetical protein